MLSNPCTVYTRPWRFRPFSKSAGKYFGITIGVWAIEVFLDSNHRLWALFWLHYDPNPPCASYIQLDGSPKNEKIIKFNSFEMVRSSYPRYILLNVWRKCEGLWAPQNSDKICTWPWIHWLVSWLVSNFQIKITENSHQFGFQTFVAGQLLSIQCLFDTVWLSLWNLCRCRHDDSVGKEFNSLA